MAQQITLSSAIRANLLSLQRTASLVARTQNRLSTGLRVASAIDDAVAFFQAKGLSDRASDLAEKKDGIDQGISSLTTALAAIESQEQLFQQMKGLLLSAKSGTAIDRNSLSQQFNILAGQANSLIADANYQGLNLLTGTENLLKVSFSEKTASFLQVQGIDVQFSNFAGITIAATVAATAFTGLTGGWSLVSTLSVTLFDHVLNILDSAITSLRSNAKTLGSNVSLLKNAARLHDRLREHADRRLRQAGPRRPQRGRRQPGCVADPPAVGDPGPGVRRPGRAGGPATLPLKAHSPSVSGIPRRPAIRALK